VSSLGDRVLAQLRAAQRASARAHADIPSIQSLIVVFRWLAQDVDEIGAEGSTQFNSEGGRIYPSGCRKPAIHPGVRGRIVRAGCRTGGIHEHLEFFWLRRVFLGAWLEDRGVISVDKYPARKNGG
jgi:hypothetical protein